MRKLTKRQIVIAAVVVAGLAVAIPVVALVAGRDGEPAKTATRATPSPSGTPSASPTPSPSRKPTTSPRPTSSPVGPLGPVPGPTPTFWGTTSAKRGRDGVEEAALQMVADRRLLPVKEGGFDDPATYCPRDRMRVSWEAPGSGYGIGAYQDPVGPAPTEETARVNGVVLCEGSTFAYVGFEAEWSTGESLWKVLPVPSGE